MSLLDKLAFLDVHYHVNPDSFVRRYSAIEAGKIYQKHRGGVVLKNHLGSCVGIAQTAQEEGLPVFSSVVLNPIAGRPWRKVIENALCMQKRHPLRLLVHLPTCVKTEHKSTLKRSATNFYVEQHGFQEGSILNEDGNLTKETLDILRMAKDEPIIISSGHANRQGVFALIEAALRLNLDRLMLNQPANPITGLSAHDLQKLSQHCFLYFEQTALTYFLKYQSLEDFAEVLTSIPNALYSSDLGQTSQMNIEEWISFSKGIFKKFSLSPQRIKDITLHTPLKMMSK